MVLEGHLARLRAITADDAAVTLQWRRGKRSRFLQAGAMTEDGQRAWIAGRVPHNEYNWIIEYRGAPVGMFALHDVNLQHRSAIIGRLLIGEPEAVGAAPVYFEAELLVSDFAFDQLKIHKLYGGILDGHATMLRTRLYLGYQQDGVLRDHLFVDGAYRNWIAVSLLEEEYRSICRPKLLRLISLYSASREKPPVTPSR